MNMNEVKMRVDAGVCRFVTDITGTSEDGMTICLRIESNCPSVKKLADDLKTIGLFDAIATPITENPLFVKCAEHLPSLVTTVHPFLRTSI